MTGSTKTRRWPSESIPTTRPVRALKGSSIAAFCSSGFLSYTCDNINAVVGGLAEDTRWTRGSIDGLCCSPFPPDRCFIFFYCVFCYATRSLEGEISRTLGSKRRDEEEVVVGPQGKHTSPHLDVNDRFGLMGPGRQADSKTSQQW